MISLPPKLIKASAGSGKTQEVTNRFLSLVLAGELPDKILATTFTRKAAGEIKTRILERINEAAKSSDGAAKLKSALGSTVLSQSDAVKALSHLVRNSHRLRVQTLDAFCIQIARSFCFEIGLDPSWKIADSHSIDKLNRHTVQKISLALGAEELAKLVALISRGDANREIHETMYEQLPTLRPFIQNTAVDIWHWLEKSHPPSESHEGLCAICAGLQPATNADGKTPNAHWVKNVKEIMEAVQVKDWGAILDKGLVDKFLAGEKFSGKSIDGTNADILSKLTGYIAQVERSKARERLQAAYHLGSLFDSFASTMEQEQSLLDFQGVKTVLADKAVLGDLAEMYFRLDSTIGHILLDEFQDTSLSEWNVIEPIIDEILSKASGEHSLLCVGDSKQAIYGWRGGVSAIFDSITNRFHGIILESLATSRRSTKEVLDCVNKIFEALPKVSSLARFESVVENWKSRYEIHHPADASKGVGHVTASIVPNEPQLKDQHVLELVNRILKGGITDDLAILVRSNKQVAHYVELLKGAGIAVQEEGGQLILASPAVSLVMAALQFLDHPGDTAAQFLIKSSPLWDDFSSSAKIELMRLRFAAIGFGRALNELVEKVIPLYPRREIEFLKGLVAEGYHYGGDVGSRLISFKEFIQDTRVNLGTAASVKVMTLHQSKGLGFDVVVLPELDDRLINSTRLPWVIPDRETALEPPSRIVPTLNKKIRNLLPEFQVTYDKYEATIVEEALCLLYVGLTRAKRGLHLIYTPTASSAVPSYAGILNEVFNSVPTKSSPINSAQVVFELGSELSPVKAQAPVKKEVREIPDTVLFEKKAKRRQPTFVSPSESEEKKGISLENLFAKDEPSARLEGSVIHSLLEKIEWIDSAALPSELVLNQKIATALQNRDFVTTLSRDGYPEGVQLRVDRELRILVRNGEEIVYGACDRVVQILRNGEVSGLDIIDYKVSMASTSELIERYSEQMHSYRKALAQSYKISIEKVGAKILTIPNGEIIEVFKCQF